MSKNYSDPNDEVEAWKDAVYEEIKDLHGKELGDYIEKKTDNILKKYGIKCSVSKVKSKRELVKV